MWDYTCIDTFKADVNQIQNSAASRGAFFRGVLKGSIFLEKFQANTFNVTNTERDSYEFMEACETIITAMPTMVSCGADTNLLPDQGEMPPVWFAPFVRQIAMEACKTECKKDSLQEYISKKEFRAGVSFGKLFDQVFLQGMPEIGAPGITQCAGTEIINFAANPKYSDLCSADPNTIANFFTYITHGMEDPRICMGSTAYEAIGLRAMSTTGDTCSDIWDCAMERLRARGNSDNMIGMASMWDHIQGIDPNNPMDTHSVMWVYDQAYIQIGLESQERVECPFLIGDGDYVRSKRSMHMTTPQIRKDGASRWVFGFADYQKLLDCEGDRNKKCGQSQVLTVPTPIPNVEPEGEG